MTNQRQQEIEQWDAGAERFLEYEEEVHSDGDVHQFTETPHNKLVRHAEVKNIKSVSWEELSEYEKQFIRKKTAELDNEELLLPDDEREYVYLSVSPTDYSFDETATILLPVFWDQELYEQSDLADLLNSVNAEKNEFSKLYRKQITVARHDEYNGFWVPLSLDDMKKTLLKYNLAEWDGSSVTPVGAGYYYMLATSVIPILVSMLPMVGLLFIPLEALIIAAPIALFLPFLTLIFVEETGTFNTLRNHILQFIIQRVY